VLKINAEYQQPTSRKFYRKVVVFVNRISSLTTVNDYVRLPGKYR